MRSPWFLAALVVALAAAGWAFFTLSSDAPERPRERGDDLREAPTSKAWRDDSAHPRTTAARPHEDHEPASDGGPDGGAGREAEAEAVGSPEPPAKGAPPPRVQPEVDLAQARADFQAVLDELDALASAERHLDNTGWVELYKRGNDALLPLQQHLDWSVPGEAEELRSAQTNLREKLHAVAPRPSDDAP